MTDAEEKYARLHECVREMREAGEVTDDVEDLVLEAMDSLWWRMTDEERRALDERVCKALA